MQDSTLNLGTVISGGGGGGGPRRNVFLGKNFPHPTIKKSKNIFTRPQISIKNKYRLLAKNVTKWYRSVVTHIPYHFCDEFDNCLCNFSCCLHMDFLWRYHLLPDKSENRQDSDSDWFTYCIDTWLVTLIFSRIFSLQYLSESCFGNDNKFHLSNVLLTQKSKFCLPNPFLFGATHKQWPIP
jgi:hypothetical protein